MQSKTALKLNVFKYFLSIASMVSLSSCQTTPSPKEHTPKAEKSFIPAKTGVFYAKETSISKTPNGDFFDIHWENISFKIGDGAIATNKASDKDPSKNSGPVIWIKEKNKKTRTLDLRNSHRSWFVTDVFHSEINKHLFVFLDWSIEGPSHSYRILLSRDGGTKWQELPSLKRPPYQFPPYNIKSFMMDEAGHGVATFFGDSAPNSIPKNKLDGYLEYYYKVTTNNWGKSWSYSKKPFAKNLLKKATLSQ